MLKSYLDFEQPILELEAKIKKIHDDPEKTAKSDKTLDKLQIERDNLISKIFNNLSDWQISQVARHPLRPHTLDYIPNIFESTIRDYKTHATKIIQIIKDREPISWKIRN